MAHPDDEVLWASSVLARAARVILAFGAVAARPVLAEGRRRALAAFPRPVEHLDIPESGAFGLAGWPLPDETEQGLALRPRARPAGREAAARYAANHARLAAALGPLLAGCRDVVTHNPWGEYGHEEHVQVLRAVEAVRGALGFRIWVPGYASTRSEALMRRHLARLGPPTAPLPTDRALADRLRRLYAEHGAWTWFDDYAWPRTEVFYPWPADMPGDVPGHVPAGAPTATPRPGAAYPLNLVWLDPPTPPPPALPLRLARRLLRRLRPRRS